MIYLLIIAVVGEVLFLTLRDSHGMDYRAREFSDALHDREVRREREAKQARRAVEARQQHRVA